MKTFIVTQFQWSLLHKVAVAVFNCSSLELTNLSNVTSQPWVESRTRKFVEWIYMREHGSNALSFHSYEILQRVWALILNNEKNVMQNK